MPTDVFVRHGFLAEADCRHLVDFFDSHIDVYGYRHADPFWSHRVISAHRVDDTAVRAVLEAVSGRILEIARVQLGLTGLEPQVSQIVCWPEGTAQPAHRDEYFSDTVLAAIVYLNDDFEGGETRFDELDVQVTPRQGTLALFDGARLLHSVAAARNGTRYTNAIWFRREP